MKFDWDLIVSSFAQQYGIRLYKEYEYISCEEFRQLLVGLNADTALGQVVSIRAETDSKKVSKMTKHEKEIRANWIQFRSKHNKNRTFVKTEDISSVLSKIFC